MSKDPGEGIIFLCKRSGQGKGCYTSIKWKVGDRVFVDIKGTDVPAIIREIRDEGFYKIVKLRIAVYAPLMGKRIVSDDPREFGEEMLRPRPATRIHELGEKD